MTAPGDPRKAPSILSCTGGRFAHEGIGMISEADIARAASDEQVGRLVEAIDQAPDNSGRG